EPTAATPLPYTTLFRSLESTINQIPGVVTVGLFAKRPADVLLVGTDEGVRKIERTGDGGPTGELARWKAHLRIETPLARSRKHQADHSSTPPLRSGGGRARMRAGLNHASTVYGGRPLAKRAGV